jgi:rhodanese-related sulfurtransferase
MGWLSELFGGGGHIRDAMQQGAVIIDLRTAYEYDQGHIPGGGCWEAMDVLRNAGLQQVINGGDWKSLLRKIQRR